MEIIVQCLNCVKYVVFGIVGLPKIENFEII